jgi:hypothetical protein
LTRIVPYYSQWESRHLVTEFISNTRSALDDPLWASSGAACVADYALWARHICGMACLKMLLEARTGVVHPTFELLRRAIHYGAYVVEGDDIRGMIYAPATEMLRRDCDVESEVITHIQAQDIPSLVSPGEFFIASVHPTIRWPDCEPPGKGGHLVLVTETTGDALTFHNPSGDTPASQEHALMHVDNFERYFSGRGILIR